MEVLVKKTIEKIIFERNKNAFQSKFNELKNISEEVKKQKEVINEVVQKNNEKIKPKENNNNSKAMSYFANLYQSNNIFMDKYEKVMKGDKYYNDIKDKIDQLIKYSNDLMIQRSNEKNNMLKNMDNIFQSSWGNQEFGGNPCFFCIFIFKIFTNIYFNISIFNSSIYICISRTFFIIICIYISVIII